MEVSKCWNIEEFSKISIKMKNFKTFYKAQTASHFKPPLFTPHLPDKSFRHLWHTGVYMEYTEIYFPSVSKMQFLGV